VVDSEISKFPGPTLTIAGVGEVRPQNLFKGGIMKSSQCGKEMLIKDTERQFKLAIIGSLFNRLYGV